MLGELLVAVPGRAVLDEAEIPLMHVLEIGVAAGGFEIETRWFDAERRFSLQTLRPRAR